MKLNVLFLYSRFPSFTNAVRDYVKAFGEYSRHNVHFYDAECGPPEFELEPYDCIILNYCFWSRRISANAKFRRRISAYQGLKIAIFQDEYDYFLSHKNDAIEMGIGTIVTGVPPQHWRDVYRGGPFDNMHFIHALTGYVTDAFQSMPQAKPMALRKWVIGYRSRPMHFKYGRLAQEKVLIGQRMRAICAERGVAANISVNEEDRIYGPKWSEFVGDCRAVLGTESGSNVFDFDGTITAAINSYLSEHPDADFETVHALFLAGRDGEIKMNQVSPRIFEAAAAHTAMILFEGEYSGVVKPWTHFIPLKKDFSNIDEVLKAARNDELLEALTVAAYRDLIASGTYHFRTYIDRIDAHISERVSRAKMYEPICGLIGWRQPGDNPVRSLKRAKLVPTTTPLRHVDRQPDPFLSVKSDPAALQRHLFHRYIALLASNKAKRVQGMLSRYPALYSVGRWGVRLLTGKR